MGPGAAEAPPCPPGEPSWESLLGLSREGCPQWGLYHLPLPSLAHSRHGGFAVEHVMRPQACDFKNKTRGEGKRELTLLIEPSLGLAWKAGFRGEAGRAASRFSLITK